jgi:hypothetical protein
MAKNIIDVLRDLVLEKAKRDEFHIKPHQGGHPGSHNHGRKHDQKKNRLVTAARRVNWER